MKKRTVLLVFLLSVCLLSSAGSFFVENQRAIWENQYEIIAMRNSSMEPTLEMDDKLIVDKRIDPAHITAAPKEADVPGDIIAFAEPQAPRTREVFVFPLPIIASRAVEKFQVDDKWYFHTKGDASSGLSYDPWSPVPEDWILGKVVDVNPPMMVPFLVVGHQYTSIRSPWTTWLVILVAAALGTGLASLLLFLLGPSKKQQATPP